MENKKPCFHFGKQGLKVLFDLFLPAYLHSVRIGFRQLTLISNRQAEAKRTTGV